MKRSFVLFSLTGMLLTSCSGDDETKWTEPDPIVRTWNLYAQKLNEEVLPLSTCDLGETFDFKSDGTLRINRFETVGEICEPAEPDMTDATWERTAENVYRMTYTQNGTVKTVELHADFYVVPPTFLTLTWTDEDGNAWFKRFRPW